jgi:hypothetical protein
MTETRGIGTKEQDLFAYIFCARQIHSNITQAGDRV